VKLDPGTRFCAAVVCLALLGCGWWTKKGRTVIAETKLTIGHKQSFPSVTPVRGANHHPRVWLDIKAPGARFDSPAELAKLPKIALPIELTVVDSSGATVHSVRARLAVTERDVNTYHPVDVSDPDTARLSWLGAPFVVEKEAPVRIEVLVSADPTSAVSVTQVGFDMYAD
jgi:hypothetical protein